MDSNYMSLRFTAKQLVSQSKRCEKECRKEKLKLKRAIEQGNTEGARIYAQNAIRQKNQAVNYLRLSSRVDAVASRVETAARMRQVTRSMSNIVVAMDRAMKEMNLEKMTKVMDEFERQFEDMDVQSEYIEQTISTTTALTTPQGEVDDLISQVATQHGLELTEELGRIVPAAPTPEVERTATEEQDVLSQRLAKLKQM